jgi:hypothetical protein
MGRGGRISSAAVAGSAKRTARAVTSAGRRSVSELPTGPSRGVTQAGLEAYRNQPSTSRGILGGIFS